MKELKGYCYKCEKPVIVVVKNEKEQCKECNSTLVRAVREN